MLSRPRALEILAFVVSYKLADALSTALVRPFLIDMGYSADDRGFALATVGLAATLFGTFFGGSVTQAMGLGRALWTFGFLQAFANIGYVMVASTSVNRPLMYAAVGGEALLSGMGTGAFSVLLLRMTQKRFSATQYAVFSSLFSLPRIVGGPVCGFLVDALGWKTFFWITIVAGAPGLMLLQRFVPIGVKDPDFEAEAEAPAGARLARGALIGRGVAGFAVGAGGAALIAALLSALKAMHGPQGKPFDLSGPLAQVLFPSDATGWVTLAGVAITGMVFGLLVAAVAAVRRRGV
jgi:PAT family beta-lactamase induction signal transducer AmpG